MTLGDRKMDNGETRLGLPILSFDDCDSFERWLHTAPRSLPGIWLKLRKKGMMSVCISKPDAIDAALCHGWIDGQQHPYDNSFWLTRFTPRRPGSRWSQLNRTRVGELIAQGRMRAAGLREVETAQADGRWDAAYAPASIAEPPVDLVTALNSSPEAAAIFGDLKRAERYAILHRLSNLKTAEGRAKSIRQIVDKLASLAG